MVNTLQWILVCKWDFGMLGYRKIVSPDAPRMRLPQESFLWCEKGKTTTSYDGSDRSAQSIYMIKTLRKLEVYL